MTALNVWFLIGVIAVGVVSAVVALVLQHRREKRS